MARVLAAASGGGHWEQLMLLADGFAEHDVTFATTDLAQARSRGIEDAIALPDCNLRRPIRALRCALAARALVERLRPEVVVSTGAAPGFFCIWWGRAIGARTLWIDSVANAEQLSLSGRLALKAGARCLTQWEHLADGEHAHYAGSVL